MLTNHHLKTKKGQEKSCDAYSMAAFMDGQAINRQEGRFISPNPIPYLPFCHKPTSE
jgi:hypothetical protein